MDFQNKMKLTEYEISWFYLWSEADTGFSSNWNTVVSLAHFGRNSKKVEDISNPYSEGMWKHVDLRTDIYRALLKLPSNYQDILYLSFTNQDFPSNIHKYFQHLAGAVLSSYPHKEITDLTNQFYLGKATDEQKSLLIEIKEQAKKNFNNAVSLYHETRRKK